MLSGSPAIVYVKRPAASVDRRSSNSSFVIVSLGRPSANRYVPVRYSRDNLVSSTLATA